MKRFINILLIILIIAAIVLATIIGINYNKRRKNDEQLQKVVEDIKSNISETKKDEEIPYIEYEGYQVIGVIKIPKIDIEYPILIESNDETLKKSITRVGNGNVNEVGNLNLAGHNYLNGSFFGKINKLKQGDEIIILDLHGKEVKYEVFDKYITGPDDVTALDGIEKDKREVTLITCKNGRSNRLIIKAREIK